MVLFCEMAIPQNAGLERQLKRHEWWLVSLRIWPCFPQHGAQVSRNPADSSGKCCDKWCWASHCLFLISVERKWACCDILSACGLDRSSVSGAAARTPCDCALTFASRAR